MAVDGVSLDVQPGEIFGLLGPNGAGKTTLIRLILGILKPDSGQISVFGGDLDSSRLERIGYMPEERGLYQDLRLERVLLYLARLKGLSRTEAYTRMLYYLERLGMKDLQKKRVRDLSKGMQQKAQIIATLLHSPGLLILDEPFSALDPINTQSIKELIREQRLNGVSIILSTHQLNHAEDLCDRIMLIDHGRRILHGELSDIMREFSDHSILVRTHQPLPQIDGVIPVQENNQTYRLDLATGTSPQQVLEFLVAHNIVIEKFEIALPSLEEIFVRAIRGAQ